MKLSKLLVLIAFLPLTFLRAAVPAGDVVELHACELYTGGCTASAQSTLGGRSLLRVWHFTGGEQGGVSLRGLSLAALETASANLAERGTRDTAAVVYFPQSANAEQKAALREWALLNKVKITVEKVAPIVFTRNDTQIALSIGDGIQLRTCALEHCDTGACGEALWYQPRSAIDHFTVLVNESSSVREPALQLSWQEHGMKSVFLGHFGGRPAGEAIFTLAFSD